MLSYVYYQGIIMKRYKFIITRLKMQTHDFLIIADDKTHVDSQELYTKAFATAANVDWHNFSDGSVDYQIDHIEEIQ